MASRLSGIDSTNISRHPSQKNPKNIENGSSFFSYFSNGRRSRKNDLSDTKQR